MTSSCTQEGYKSITFAFGVQEDILFCLYFLRSRSEGVATLVSESETSRLVYFSTPLSIFHNLCAIFTILHILHLKAFLAALAALYPPLSLINWLIHGLEFSFRVLTKPYQTIPTTYPTHFLDPPELPSHLTYPPTWPTHPSVLPTHLILNPSTQITSLNPFITSLSLHAAS